MTSSTPSPSAQELADAIEARIKAGQHVVLHIEQARWVATLLCRLSDTERERDEARALLDAEMLRCPDTSALTCARAWGVPPRWAMHHIDTDKARAAAEAERDALREMLAQADAVIAATCNPEPVADEMLERHMGYQHDAIARHHDRLSQKG